MKNKLPLLCACVFLLSRIFAGEAAKGAAAEIAAESAKKATVEKSVEFIEESLRKVTAAADKRALYIFLGSLYEQLARYDSARESYAAAAGIAAGDVENMPKKSNEQLVLDAVRCALSLGDGALADSYLNSAVRNSDDKEIQAYIKLYSQWSSLCKADKPSDVDETVVLLKAYAQMPSMETVRPAVFLTLWYLTGEEEYSAKLKKDFPSSMEAAIVSGKVQLMPAPFWFFVPHSPSALSKITDSAIIDEFPSERSSSAAAVSASAAGSDAPAAGATLSQSAPDSTKGSAAPAVSQAAQDSESEKPLYLQLGLFRERENAQTLVSRLVEKGFASKILSEKRKSGTTYYIVAVDYGDGSVASELRTAGFDCYPVFQ
ncbi:SPOR domain-containing protein [Treponema parvum]|uniref:SPOR domain-containing protein n=1 Tax=Treponema parvum TaxID=138851 RepID=UPI001AEC4C25|nr:SPOR domain-containing protein [Treponema parvum]QTQ15790.1 SPOR domain-containing protein [Treponema parvum]